MFFGFGDLATMTPAALFAAKLLELLLLMRLRAFATLFSPVLQLLQQLWKHAV